MAVTINGTTGVSGVDGSAGSPAIQGGDTNTGMFFPAADTIAFATAGTEEFRIGPAGQLGIQGANYGTSGQVLTSGGASASPSWATPTSGMTLLGTLDTTTGSSQSLSSLTLTNYKQLVFVFRGVSHNDTTGSRDFLIGTSTSDDVIVCAAYANTSILIGTVWVELSDGKFTSVIAAGSAAGTARSGTLTLRTSSTTISVAPAAGSFDAGSILVYGMS